MAETILLTGMHRSGTSLAASFLHDLGAVFGDDLLPPDAFNPRGYWEDRSLLAFNRRLLLEACPSGDPGWPDWGWTETERLDRGHLPAHLEEARELILAQGGGGPRALKDPRTSLLLDFWHEAVPEARYVFVFRAPWDVADSVRRLRNDLFRERPDYPFRIWAHYNRHLLAFYEAHRDRCAVFEVEELRGNPGAIGRRLCDALALDPSHIRRAVDALETRGLQEGLLRTLSEDHATVALLDQLRPEWGTLYAALQAASRSSTTPPPSAPRAPSQGVVRRSSTTGQGRQDAALTVVIPCFNQGAFLKEAVGSVLESDDSPHEVVVVNDGSTEEETLAALASVKEQGVWVIDQENRGLSEARNAGIRVGHGRYVLPLDADNRIRTDYIPRAIEALDSLPNVAVVYGDAWDFGERNGRRIVGAFDLDRMVEGNRIDACAVVRRSVWEECGGYDPLFTQGFEDWDLWLSVAERGLDFHYVPEVLFDYRVRTGSLSSAFQEPGGRRRILERIVSKHPGLFGPRLPRLFVQKDQDWLGARLEADRLRTRLESRLGVGFTEREAEVARLREELGFLKGTRALRLRDALLRIRRAVGL